MLTAYPAVRLAMTEVIAGRADFFFIGIALRTISFQSCENHTLPKEISRI